MPTDTMKLVTIVCEALARERVTRLLRETGAHGYTLFEVEGDGAHGTRTAEMMELANIQIQVIVPAVVAARLQERLEKEFFPKYAMITYESDVRVRRPNKF